MFGTTSITAIGELKLDELRAGNRKLMELAGEKGKAHFIEIDGQRKFRPGPAPADAALDEALAADPQPEPQTEAAQPEAPSKKGRKAAQEQEVAA